MSEQNLKNPALYVNRELGQIEFNRRVLAESMNRTHPLLERAKYLAIYASNMDEFFMVRVSGLKQQVWHGVSNVPPDGLTPREQLSAINRVCVRLVEDQAQYWRNIEEELISEGIQIRNYSALKSNRQNKLRRYFTDEIFPALTPLAFDPSHPFPHISNLSLNLAVVVNDPDLQVRHFARVKVPATLPRLVPLRRFDPDDIHQSSGQKFVWIEQVIKANLDMLFPGMEIVDAYPFRVTRNNDMEIQEEEADDLLLTLEESLRQRHFGQVVRLEIEESMPDHIRAMLMRNFEISQSDVYSIDGPLALNALWELLKLERPDLKDTPHRANRSPLIVNSGKDIFTVLREQDILVHRPYESFGDVIAFLNAAANDPDVVAIKMTLYRVGRNPAVVSALMHAREKGKQVAVLVEIKARFDEESNITWARALEKAGVHVIYGLIGLKTHAKITMVVRREGTRLRRYMHLSTGNYNATTAKVYEDIDLLTSREDLGEDATDIFNYLTGYSRQRAYQKFLVAPITLRPQLLTLIEQEATHEKNGRIVIKCNSLVDDKMIRALYRASQAGVQVDLIVRGICGLRPGIKGVSDNIRVVSVVGRFLEHSRIFYFQNMDAPILYAGSADLMSRNLDRRVEIVFPIESPEIQTRILQDILEPALRDTQQAHEMQSNGQYRPPTVMTDSDVTPFSSQQWMLENAIKPVPLL